MAQAYWKKGEHQLAIDHYQRYLEADPGTRNRSRIMARIRELSAALEKSKPSDQPSPVDQPTAARTLPATSSTFASPVVDWERT